MLTLLYIALFHIATIANAQQETRFFVDRFNASNWLIENTGLYSNPVNWIDSTTCTGSDDKCVTIKGGGAIISKTIPTAGYYAIYLLIDSYQVALDSYEYCYVEYKTDAVSSWTKTNLEGSALKYDVKITIPDNANYNDQASFKVRLGNSASGSDEICYFEDLEVFGIPYNTITTTTRQPTASPITSLAPSAPTEAVPSPSADNVATQDTKSNDNYGTLMIVISILSTMVCCGCIGMILFAVWKCRAKRKEGANPNKSVHDEGHGNGDGDGDGMNNKRGTSLSLKQMEMQQQSQIDTIESLVNSEMQKMASTSSASQLKMGETQQPQQQQDISDLGIWDT